MLKKIVLVGGALASLMMVAAVGCSSSSDNGVAGSDSGTGEDTGRRDGSITNKDSGVKDGATPKDGSVIVPPNDSGVISKIDGGGFDGGTTTEDGGSIPACFMSGNAEMLNSGGPLAHQNQCNSTQVAAIDTGCFEAGATTVTCDTASSAAPGCADCLFGAFPDGGVAGAPSAAFLVIDSAGDAVPNVPGCVAAISSGTPTCKANFENLIFCSDTACQTCADAPSSTACTDFATSDPASICTEAFVVDAACNDAINAVSDVDAQTKCGAGAATFSAGFIAVGTTMCGP